MAWRNTWAAIIREPALDPVVPGEPLPWPRRILAPSARVMKKFWEHGDLFSSAAISFYALFSILPLVILFLVGLQVFVPYELVQRNLGRLFGLTESDLVLRTVRDAYAQEATLGWLGAVTLVFAAAGVFSSVQVALDRIWESRGRVIHHRLLVGILSMTASLVIILGMILATVYAFRFIRTSFVGALLGWPRTPPRGGGHALAIATWVAQFLIFWFGYRFLPNVPVRWRDALPGAVIAALVWHVAAYGLGWYLGTIGDYTTLYHSLGGILALILWVYGLCASFLLGAEIVAQRTLWPRGRGDPRWREPLQGPPPAR